MAGFRRGLRLPSPILRERAFDIVRFIEAAILVAPNEPLIAVVGLDELAFAGHVGTNADAVDPVAPLHRSRLAEP